MYVGQYTRLIQKLLLVNPILDYEKCFIKPTTPWTKKYFENASKKLDNEGCVKIGNRQFESGKKLFEEMLEYCPGERLKSYMDPLLIIHGDKDSIVDCQNTYNYFQSLPSNQKRFEKIEGSEHGFHDEPFETIVTKLIVKFFIIY